MASHQTGTERKISHRKGQPETLGLLHVGVDLHVACENQDAADTYVSTQKYNASEWYLDTPDEPVQSDESVPDPPATPFSPASRC
jgi:hypothetical protein